MAQALPEQPIPRPPLRLVDRRRDVVLLPDALILDPKLGPGSVRLYAYLAIARTRSDAFPSRPTIARELRLSINTVDSHLRELEQTGWLRRMRLNGAVTHYDFPRLDPDGAPTKPAPEVLPAITMPKPTPMHGGLEERFNLCFWDLWPKRVCKADALKAWIKLRPDELTIQRIRQALHDQLIPERFAHGDTRTKELIPNPATWLNGQRWNNDPSTDRETYAHLARQAEAQAATRERLAEPPTPLTPKPKREAPPEPPQPADHPLAQRWTLFAARLSTHANAPAWAGSLSGTRLLAADDGAPLLACLTPAQHARLAPYADQIRTLFALDLPVPEEAGSLVLGTRP